jgi:16S rRNA (cytidine1402-2'-O)-methyltransferase
MITNRYLWCMKTSLGKLYLVPSFIAETDADTAFPLHNKQVVTLIRDFLVEDERTARRFLRKMNPLIRIEDINFLLLNKHTPDSDLLSLLGPVLQGRDMALLSEAGMPCIADPGAVVVGLAHEMGVKVLPLTGPSSIFLALAASGFNGQEFCFHGYLPIDRHQRVRRIRELESEARQKSRTQIFIETPYRNKAMLEAILHSCRPATRLCVAAAIGGPEEWIRSCTIQAWKDLPEEPGKRPAVFLISA